METFTTWLKSIDSICESRIGLSVHDLADQPFHDWYEDGMSASQAFRSIRENEGF